jgi:hypothetical protein
VRIVVAGVFVALAGIVAWIALGRRSTSELPGPPVAASSPEVTGAVNGASPGSAAAASATLDSGIRPEDPWARAAAQAPTRPDVGSQTGSGSSAPYTDDIYKHGALVTSRGMREIPKILSKLVRECYDTAHAQRPNIRGRLRMSVVMKTEPGTGNLVATADLDETATTVTDREFLECATENVFAAEEVLDQLRAAGDESGGNMRFVLDATYPPGPTPKQPKWPGDDESPPCAAGTVLKGDKPPRGTKQWCERSDGTKHGDEYNWSNGKLEVILIYEEGHSSKARFRPSED